jgi:peptidyl-prolyl cis-trans isomerase D
VRKEIAADLAKQKGQKKFAEAAEGFGNLVYEQSDSLKPAAERFGLKIRTSDWIGRNAGPEAGPLGNAKLLAALFSTDALSAKRNTDAIEVAGNVLVSARVLEHQAAAVRPLDATRAEIEQKLKKREAARLAAKDGAARLEQLAKGADPGVKWSSAKLVSRKKPENVPPDALARILAVDAAKVPAHFGIERDDGYTLYRVTKVLPPEPRKEDQHKADLANAERMAGAEQYSAYVEALRARARIEINKAAIEKK